MAYPRLYKPEDLRKLRPSEVLSAKGKLAVISKIWSNDILQSQASLQDYCQAVAERFETMFGEKIAEPITPASVYDALKEKGIIR